MLTNSMELLLNLFWLLLALASVGLWRLKWSRAGGRESLQGAIGLCCVLVLLFFAISLTDDLHEIPAVAEDTSSPYRPLRVWKANPIGPETGKHAAPFAAIVPSKLFSQAERVVGRVLDTDAPRLQRASNRPFEGRAPPLSSARTL